jgi:hypothetical protein
MEAFIMSRTEIMKLMRKIEKYVDQAMEQAVYDKQENGTFAGQIPSYKEIVAYGNTLHKFENELRSRLKNWIWVKLKLGYSLPVIGGIDLNKNSVSKPATPLGRKLWEIRAKIIASGEPLLDWNDIERELAESRREIE